MLKMTIDNEEVVSKNNFTIKEEMLSPSSTILNNTYPKSWEDDKNYTSRFYYPKDYAKLDIQNFSITPEEAGTTIDIVGSATLTDVDTTKESRVLSLKGQTSQNGTPTPTSPIPVNVVSGDNEINICGKNLNNVLYSNIHLLLNWDGTTVLNNSYNSVIVDTRNVNSIYVSGDFSTIENGGIRTGKYNDYPSTSTTGTRISFPSSGSINTTNVNYVLLSFQPASGKTFTDIQNSIQIEYGNQATTYEPYTGNTYPLYLGVENLSQLENISTTVEGYITRGNSTIGTLKANTTYTLSMDCSTEYTSTTKNLSIRNYYVPGQTTNEILFDLTYKSGQRISCTFTPNYDGELSINSQLGASYTNVLTNIELVKGSTAQYVSDTPIELCKIGTYQDYIYKDNGSWYVHKEIGKVVLDGSEGWNKHGSITSWFYYDGITDGYVLDNTQILIKTNYYTPKAYQGVPNLVNGECAYGSSDSGITHRFVIKNTDYTQTNDFKNWLSTHNTIVYYVLATPTNTLIEDTNLIEQLESLSS